MCLVCDFGTLQLRTYGIAGKYFLVIGKYFLVIGKYFL